MSTTPISQDPNSPEALAARKARYTELRRKLGRSKLEVKGKPGMHYFWADHVRDQGELIRLSTFNYLIVREPKAAEVLKGTAKPEIQANGLQQDGTYIIGDVILMACPEEVYEFIMLDQSERHEELVKGVSETFKSNAEGLGVPTFEPKPRTARA